MELEEGEILDTSSGASHSLQIVDDQAKECYSKFVNSVTRNTHANVRAFRKTPKQNGSQPNRYPLVPTRASLNSSMNIGQQHEHAHIISNQNRPSSRSIGPRPIQGGQDKYVTRANKDIRAFRSCQTHTVITQETHTLSTRKLSRSERRKRRTDIDNYESYMKYLHDKREMKKRNRQKQKEARRLASSANASQNTQPLMTKLFAAGFAKQPTQTASTHTNTNPTPSKPHSLELHFVDDEDCDVLRLDFSPPSPLSVKTEKLSIDDGNEDVDYDSEIEVIIPPKKIPLCVTLDSDGEEVQFVSERAEPSVQDESTSVLSIAQKQMEHMLDSLSNEVKDNSDSDTVRRSPSTTLTRNDSISSPKYPESEFDFEITFSPSSPSSIHSSAEDKVRELESSKNVSNPTGEGSPTSNSGKLTDSSRGQSEAKNALDQTNNNNGDSHNKSTYDEFGICTTSSYLKPQNSPDQDKVLTPNVNLGQSQSNSSFGHSKNELLSNYLDDSELITEQSVSLYSPSSYISKEIPRDVSKEYELAQNFSDSVDQLLTCLRDEEPYSPNSNYEGVGRRFDSTTPSLPFSFANSPSNTAVLSLQSSKLSKSLKQTTNMSVSTEELYSPDSNYGKVSDKRKVMAKSSLTSSFANTPLTSCDFNTDDINIKECSENKKTSTKAQCSEILILDTAELSCEEKDKSDDEDISELRKLALSTKGRGSQNSTPNRHHRELKEDESQSSASEEKSLDNEDEDILHLRVAALKSAVIKKHEERKKRGVTIKKKRHASTSLEDDIIPLTSSTDISTVDSSLNSIDSSLPKNISSLKSTKSPESLKGEEDMEIDSDDGKTEEDTCSTDDQIVKGVLTSNQTEPSSTRIVTDQQCFNPSQPPPPGVDFNGSPAFFSAQSQRFSRAVSLPAIPPALTFPSLVPPPPPPPISPPNPFESNDNLVNQSVLKKNDFSEDNSAQNSVTPKPSTVNSISITNESSLNLEPWSKSYPENSLLEPESNDLSRGNNLNNNSAKPDVKSLRPNLKPIPLVQTSPSNPLSNKKLKKQRQRKKKTRKLLEKNAQPVLMCITSKTTLNKAGENKCLPPKVPLCTISSDKQLVISSLPNQKSNVPSTVTSSTVQPSFEDQTRNSQCQQPLSSTDPRATIFSNEGSSKASFVQDEEMDLNDMIVLDEVGMSPEHRSRSEPMHDVDSIEENMQILTHQALGSLKSTTQNYAVPVKSSSKCVFYPEKKGVHRNIKDRLGLQVPSSKPIQFENFSVTRKVKNNDSSKYKLSRVIQHNVKRSVVQDSDSLKVVIPTESPPLSGALSPPPSAPVIGKFIIRVDKDSDSEEESEWLRKVRIQESAITKPSDVNRKHSEDLEQSIDMLLMNARKTVETPTTGKCNSKKPTGTNNSVNSRPVSAKENATDYDDISDTPLQYLPKERQEEYQRLKKLVEEKEKKLMEKRKSLPKKASANPQLSLQSKNIEKEIQKPEVETGKLLTLSERLSNCSTKTISSQSNQQLYELQNPSHSQQNKAVIARVSTKDKIPIESEKHAVTLSNNSLSKQSTEKSAAKPNNTKSGSTLNISENKIINIINRRIITNTSENTDDSESHLLKKPVAQISPPINKTALEKNIQNVPNAKEKRLTLKRGLNRIKPNPNKTQSCDVLAPAGTDGLSTTGDSEDQVKKTLCDNQIESVKDINLNKVNLGNNTTENDTELENSKVVAEKKKHDNGKSVSVLEVSKELAPKVLVELGNDEVQIYSPIRCDQQVEPPLQRNLCEETETHIVDKEHNSPSLNEEKEPLKIQPKDTVLKTSDVPNAEKLVSNQEELLCERFLLIDELTEVSDSLSQLERGQAELEQVVVEISQLRDKLRAAERLLQTKRQSTQQLETAIYSSHQTMFMRNLKIKRLETTCQQMGRVLRGGKYEIPVRGKELMTKKVQQFIKKRDSIKRRRQILTQFMEDTDTQPNFLNLDVPCESFESSSLPHPDTSRIPPFPFLPLQVGLIADQSLSSSPQSPPMYEKGLPPFSSTTGNQQMFPTCSEFTKGASPQMGISGTVVLPIENKLNSNDKVISETHTTMDGFHNRTAVKTDTNKQCKKEAVCMSLDEIAALTKSFIVLSDQLDRETEPRASMDVLSVSGGQQSPSTVNAEQLGNCDNKIILTSTEQLSYENASLNTKENVLDDPVKRDNNQTLSKKRLISQIENADLDQFETKKVLLKQQNTQNCSLKPKETLSKGHDPTEKSSQPAQSLPPPKRFKSKLQYKSILRHKHDTRAQTADSECVLCPYDLSGRCHDPTCKYKHFTK